MCSEWTSGRSRPHLDGGVGGKQLGWEVRLGDGGVVRRKVVAGVTEGADPQLPVEVDAGVRVQTRRAPLAPHGVVGHHRHLRKRFARRHHRAEWHDALGGFDLAVGPHVPVWFVFGVG